MFEPTVANSVRWYRVYCFANASLYLLAASVFLLGWAQRDLMAATYLEFHENGAMVVAQVMLLLVLLFVVLGGFCLWLPFAKRRPVFWVIHFINCVLGATSCIFTPICVYLIVLFLKPEIRAYWEGRETLA